MRFALFATALTALAASGCAAVQPERSFGRDLDDQTASLAIKNDMLRATDFWFGGVDVEVADGLALLAGTVPRERDRRFAECLAWQPSGVRDVANELEIAETRRARGAVDDGWITRRIDARLTADRDVRASNMNVEVHDGVVHILGIARTAAERERAAELASEIRGVERVVVHLRLVDETPDFTGRAAARERACDGFQAELPGGG